jgi:DNA helicase II / ATP-dependent DNA helicase PcrA
MQIETPSETWLSLRILLKTLFDRIKVEYRFLTLEEKIDLVVDTLQNNALKQYLMYVNDSQVTLSTIHGSKGLEWDYVILPDMEKFSFPTYQGLCRVCGSSLDCKPDWAQVFQDENSNFYKFFKEEINVFYVGGTRARKATIFTFSDEGISSKGEKRNNLPSCFLKLVGFQLNFFE